MEGLDRSRNLDSVALVIESGEQTGTGLHKVYNGSLRDVQVDRNVVFLRVNNNLWESQIVDRVVRNKYARWIRCSLGPVTIEFIQARGSKIVQTTRYEIFQTKLFSSRSGSKQIRNIIKVRVPMGKSKGER